MGMFEKTIITLDPGWDQDAKPLDSSTDVRGLSGVAATMLNAPQRSPACASP